MISSIPSNSVSVLAPYAPQGRSPVSQESSDLKSSTFKAAEQLAESGRSLNRRQPDERPNEEVEQERVSGDRSVPQDKNAGDKRSLEERQIVEQKQIQELAARDREVRAHEQAHAAIAGQLGGSPSYTYTRGPDGVSYAVGGEVAIDTSPVPGDPEATIRKAQQIRRAANAPADPSGQDRQVSAQAAQMEQQARVELREKQALAAKQSEEGAVDKSEKAAPTDNTAKAEESARVEKEQRVRDEEKEKARFADEQRQLDQRRARAELFSQFGQRNIDINRRLVDIGVFESSTSRGGILDKTV